MKRALLLTAFISISASAIYLLPPFKVTPSAMGMEVPEELGPWLTQSYPASEKERATLAPDTQFSKARCFLPRQEEASLITGKAPYDMADLSIVMSGEDLANSIHRPERCMPAQGHEIYSASDSAVKMPDGHELPVRRLLSMQELTDATGKPVRLHAVTYYFFVGHEDLTPSHSARNKLDIKHRLLKGEAQHWAYISATMNFVEDKDFARGTMPTLKMADEKLASLLSTLAERNVDWKMLGNHPGPKELASVPEISGAR